MEGGSGILWRGGGIKCRGRGCSVEEVEQQKRKQGTSGMIISRPLPVVTHG